ncbi:hypothetical protein FCM35_KLT07267 [Carex littledalei]|uniref:Uncharacterized protein n=1 Tax=Carex littledalei TaxID=544730 RepID=A0A833VKT8_9POAL|nr:hypothetical protein FCM35_KLT07267 [Carex littledalei]
MQGVYRIFIFSSGKLMIRLLPPLLYPLVEKAVSLLEKWMNNRYQPSASMDCPRPAGVTVPEGSNAPSISVLV